eukprot:g14383.t1
MKGLLKQFKNNVRFPTKDGGSSSSASSSASASNSSNNRKTAAGRSSGTSSTTTAAVLNNSSNLNASQANGIVNHGGSAAAATANGGRPGGNGVAPGVVDPAQAIHDATNGGAAVLGATGGAAGLGAAAGAAGGAGVDRMPPPPPKSGGVKAGVAPGQLHGGVVAPSSSTPTLINGVEDTPVADPELPRRASNAMTRRSMSFESSRSNEHTYVRQEYMKELPLLRDTAQHQREALFQQKLKLCTVVFDMTDPMENSRDKEVKRCTLLELVEYINSAHGQQIFSPAVMPDVIAMVKANICRALPPQPDDCDPDKDEPLLEEAWPHLQIVYEFLVRFVVSSEVDAKQAKAYVDQALCLQLVDLFDSEDPRERDYLKTILHRVYGKFMMHRAFIRRAVGNAFLRFVYECPRHNGIGELLEILGSIVNGFATPLKKEHVDFLQVCLLPLHTPSMVNIYHQQLSYCVVQYVEKEADTATHILKSLIRFWPWRSSSKQVIFLNELEEVLELLMGPDQITEVEEQLFNLLARCISSEHFQVAERALFLWNNEHLVTVGVLSMQYPNPLLPVIYGPLRERSTRHWNTTVEGLAHNVLRMYNEQDAAAFERCHQQHVVEEEERGRRRSKADKHWALLEELAQLKAGE